MSDNVRARLVSFDKRTMFGPAWQAERLDDGEWPSWWQRNGRTAQVIAEGKDLAPGHEGRAYYRSDPSFGLWFFVADEDVGR